MIKMKKQEIIIELEEYKELLMLAAEYEKVLGQYQLLSYAYQQVVGTEQATVKKKEKIGF